MLRAWSAALLVVCGCWQAPRTVAPANRGAAPDATPRRELVTRVIDAHTAEPVQGALVIVVRQDVTPSDIDVLRWQQVADGHGKLVDELVVSSGRCDGAGVVTLIAPPKGTYDVVVLGRDYEPLHGAGGLRMSEDLPPDPKQWREPAKPVPFGQIRLIRKPQQ